MRLILIRHGEATGNVKKFLHGRMNTRLTKIGKEQVIDSAKFLINEKIDVVFSSSLQRCKSTTKLIIDELDLDVPVNYTNEIIERDFGVFEGKKFEKLIKQREKEGVPHHLYRPNGGENYGDIYKRVIPFIENLKQEYHGKTVLLVTHSCVARTILCYFMEKDISEVSNMEIGNAEIVVVDVDKNNKITFIKKQ